jgi:hypothetical protein
MDCRSIFIDARILLLHFSGMKAKATYQKWHAIRRFAERCGLELTPSEYRRLCKMISHEDPVHARFLCRSSNRVKHWAVQFKGNWIPVIYDSKRKQIVTALPPDALRKSRYRDAVLHHRLSIPEQAEQKPFTYPFPIQSILAGNF